MIIIFTTLTIVFEFKRYFRYGNIQVDIKIVMEIGLMIRLSLYRFKYSFIHIPILETCFKVILGLN